MAESSSYPTALDSTNIYEVVARLSSTLSDAIGTTTTTIPITSTTNFPTAGYIVIDNETIKYISVSVGSVDATGGRGHAGTAAAHTSGTQVLVAVVAALFNKLRAGLIAVQTNAGTSGTLGTPGINARWLGGSTETQLNVGYLGGSTEGQLNVGYLGGSTMGELAPTYGKNLIKNSAFLDSDGDDLPDFWDLTLTPTLAIAADTLFLGRQGNQITMTAGGAGYEGIKITGGAANWLKVLPSTKYAFSIDYKVTGGDFLAIYIRSYNGAVEGTLHVNVTSLASTDAIRVSYTFTTDSDADNLEIRVQAKNDGDICIVSHPKLEEGSIATPYIPDEIAVDQVLAGKKTFDEGAIIHAPKTYTPAGGATATLDLSLGNNHEITMPAGNITIAISDETDGQYFTIDITQDGTGSRTVTWFSTIKWADGSAPTLTTTADKRDSLGFKVTGTDTYDGFVIGQNI